MKSAEIWNELGNTYFKADVLDKAIDAYGKAVEQKPQLGWSYSNLASVYAQQGRFSEAIPLYQKSLELFTRRKDQVVTWRRLGNVYHYLNEYDKAINAYQKADELMSMQSPEKISSTFPQDKANLKHDANYSTGMTSIHSAYQDWQDDPALVYPLGDDEETLDTSMEHTLSGSEIFKDCLSKVENGIEKNANVWNELGSILFKVGAYDNAINAYQKAIELDPTFGCPYSNMGLVYAVQGKLVEAVDLYEKSIKLLPNNQDKAVSWTRLADSYRQMGQYEQAMVAYQLSDELARTLAEPIHEFRQVNSDLIITNPGQIRALDDIDDLVVSIRMHGIIQPLVVCPAKNEPEKYLLIAGRRRLEAARRAGLRDVPVIVRRANDQEILELSINENIHSAVVSQVELANGYRQMVNDFDLTIEEISARVGKSCHSVTSTMKILELPEDVGQTLDCEGLGHDPIRAEIYPLVVGLQDTQANESGLDQIDAAKIRDNDVSPVLWYKETESEDAATRPDDGYYSETTSLLTRARHVLMCNPHVKRLWSTPSYRA